MLKKTLALLPLLAALVSPAAAEVETSWYEVEVIIFRQWQAGGADAEYPRPDTPAPAAENVASLNPPAPGAPLTPYARLAENELRLRGSMQALTRHKAYEPLLHVGWRQPGLGRADAPMVALPPGWLPEPLAASADEPAHTPSATSAARAEAKPPLYGLIRVFRERYLHAEVDLRYGEGGEPEYILDEEGRWVLSAPPPAEVHRQSRRMRGGELHFLDHPTLGVLIQVTPVETAAGSGN